MNNPHRNGRRSYAQRGKRMRTTLGREPNRAEVWAESRRRKDGSLDPRAEELMKVASSTSLCSESGSTAAVDKAFVQLFGPEHSGRVRGLGHGVTPTKYFRPSSAGGLLILHKQITSNS